MKYIFYEDIPKEEQKELRKKAVKNNFTIRLWNVCLVLVSMLIATSVAKAGFPDRNDFIGRLILVVIIVTGLIVLFFTAVVEPKIIRAIEKEKNS